MKVSELNFTMSSLFMKPSISFETKFMVKG
jgi:hypothetical protein